MRVDIQVLVLPFIRDESKVLYAIFQRADENYWQGIAGGAEEGEDPLQAAKREADEEAGLSQDLKFVHLESMCTIPFDRISGLEETTNQSSIVVKEFSFAVEATNHTVKLSSEHTQVEWVSYQTAFDKFRWDSNKNALWELNYKITNGLI